MVSAYTIPHPAAAPVAQKAQIDSLHGLRFAAALLVLVMHACAWIAQFDNSDLIPRLGALLGVFGMPLFFVLSGFVIQYNYALLFEKKRFGHAIIEFAGARFARLYPLFIVFMVSGMFFDQMIMWVENLAPDLYVYLFHQATLTQSWFYVLVNHRLALNHANALSWSISVEVFFYAAFPFVVLAISHLKTIRSTVIAWLAFAAIGQFLFIEGALWRGYLTYWFSLVSPQTLAQGGDTFERFLFYFSPYARGFEFILGCLTARIFTALGESEPNGRERRWGRGLFWGAVAALAFLAWANFARPPTLHVVSYLVQNTFGSTIPIAVLIFCVARYRSRTSSFLASPPLVALGELSYSIYLIHAFVLRPYFITDPHPQSLTLLTGSAAIAKIVFTTVLTIILSYGTYKVIEAPSRRIIRRWVAALLARIYGPSVVNSRDDAATRSINFRWAAAIFVALMAACLTYQFVILRWIAPHLA
jgi:peptidoglycan/LPS O-acetylase OafA/YrhL